VCEGFVSEGRNKNGRNYNINTIINIHITQLSLSIMESCWLNTLGETLCGHKIIYFITILIFFLVNATVLGFSLRCVSVEIQRYVYTILHLIMVIR
jgi:hypothetical protein